jgi:hypothetical protein
VISMEKKKMYSKLGKLLSNVQVYFSYSFHTASTNSQMFAQTVAKICLLASLWMHIFLSMCNKLRFAERISMKLTVRTLKSYNYCISGHYPSSCFYFKHTMFHRPDFLSIFLWNLLSWAQLKESLSPDQKHNNCINITSSQIFGWYSSLN